MKENPYIRWFEALGNNDVALVGGKNASLGEMTSTMRKEGIPVPQGFATTAAAYREFLRENGLEAAIRQHLAERGAGRRTLEETGQAIRALILKGTFPKPIEAAIRAAYREIGRRYGVERADVAVRSSATAEDLPEASFAGQQESFLNIQGEEALMAACVRCYASLFTDRAIVYREAHAFDSMQIALSIGVQKMVRSDRAGSGVIFTLDTETGFPDVVLISAAWGLGEPVVKGTVTPDQYTVFKPFLGDAGLRPIIGRTCGEKAIKMVYADGQAMQEENMLERWDDDGGFEPEAAHRALERLAGKRTVTRDTSEAERRAMVLSDDEILMLARWAVRIETHYGRPMDIEWAKDGDTGACFIVQARPETVQSRRTSSALRTYRLKEAGEELVRGLSIGDAMAKGPVCRIERVEDIGLFRDGSILVTRTTDPDWVPIMKRAAGIVTDHGGRTSHAAIVSRELGVPAIVGAGNATEVLRDGQDVTLSCAQGDEGYVYAGLLDFEEVDLDLSAIPETRTRIMINIASPAAAMRWWRLPSRGVGLARMEYIINNVIKIHPMALVEPERVQDEAARARIETLTRGYADKTDYFVEHLAQGIAMIAASQHPDPVIVRTSDFKTNEYAHLIGGAAFEPEEENPMLGWRGASRYYSDDYRAGFALECRAIRRVREEMGFTNVIVMIPFCRTLEEADRVLAEMAANGLRRGVNGLEVYVMAEIPANVTLAARFAERFDGFSIGSNDLTQLMLGVDRDSAKLAYLFDERNEAVIETIRDLIVKAHAAGRPVGICGQAPSDHPDFAAFLVDAGIDSISLLPDSVLRAVQTVAEAERAQAGETPKRGARKAAAPSRARKTTPSKKRHP
ncbi:MAG: phosphoenolpyruvate synthase [Rhodothermales bacterium]